MRFFGGNESQSQTFVLLLQLKQTPSHPPTESDRDHLEFFV